MSTADQLPPATAAGAGDPPEPTPAPPALPDLAQQLADQLLGGEVDGLTVEVGPAPDDPPAEPETPPAAAAPDTPAPAAAPATPPAAPPAPQDAPAELVLPKVPHPFDEEDDPDLEEIDPKFTRIRENVGKLRDKLRAAREASQFGRAVIDTAVANGLDPTTLASVVALTARSRQGDAQARQQLAGIMQQVGVFAAPQAPPPPPAPVVVEATKAEADAVYQTLFAADVAAGDMDEEVAHRKAQQIATREKRASTPPSPPPSALSQPAPPTPPAPPAPDAPREMDPVEQAATADLVRLERDFIEAYRKVGLDFGPIKAEALARIREQAQREGAIPPIRWAFRFSEVVRQIQTERAAKATDKRTPVTKTGTPPLRPSSKSTAGAPSDDWRTDLVDKLWAGDIDNL